MINCSPDGLEGTPSKRKSSLDDGLPSKRLLLDTEQTLASPAQSGSSEVIHVTEAAKYTDGTSPTDKTVHVSNEEQSSPCVEPRDKLSNPVSAEELRKQKAALLCEISSKKEKLRKLTMVKLYRSKNDLSELDDITNKWRTVCQEAVVDLHNKLNSEPKPSLIDFIGFLQIDPVQLRFDKDQEEFL